MGQDRIFKVVVLGGAALVGASALVLVACGNTHREGPPPPIHEGPPPPVEHAPPIDAAAPPPMDAAPPIDAAAPPVDAAPKRPPHREGPPPPKRIRVPQEGPVE